MKQHIVILVIKLVASTYVTTRQVGSSIVVTIPKALANAEGIRPKQTIKITVEKVRKNYRGAFKGLGPFVCERDRLITNE